MKAYSGLLFILIWMQTGNLVKTQDCHLASFLSSDHYDSNFDITGLKESYILGSTVRVPCNVGYVGSFKLLCMSDVGVKWIRQGSKCEPKSCGHPGDAEYAEFHLVEGEDYVFGSTVEYTCQTGYQMVSRINRRRCMASGWDGFLPVCEAKQCPAIHVNENIMQVTGEPLDASYGHVLRFRCKQNHLEVDGPKQIYCNEHGEWSAQPPTCKERTCGHPGDVQFAEFNQTKGEVYALGSAVQYTCQTGYQMLYGSSIRRCTLNGWDGGMPRCEIKRCPALRVDYNTEAPEAHLEATPGHVLQFRCKSPDMVLIGPVQIHCKDNGVWSDRPPKCKVCSTPLGIKNDVVQNDQMTSSSVYRSFGTKWHPFFGRLDETGYRNAWRAETNDQLQWLQVDLGCSKTITGIITQGGGGVVSGTSYVTSFKVSYSDDGGPGTVIKDANGSDKIFPGNSEDQEKHKPNLFEPPITSRYVRVLPWTWERHITMRIELLGCGATA